MAAKEALMKNLAQQQQLLVHQKNKKIRTYIAISLDEFYERRDRGLCEICEEPFSMDHVCKKVSSNHQILHLDEDLVVSTCDVQSSKQFEELSSSSEGLLQQGDSSQFVKFDIANVDDNSEVEVEIDVVQIDEVESISSITIDNANMDAQNVFDQMPRETEVVSPQPRCDELGCNVHMNMLKQVKQKLNNLKVFDGSPLEKFIEKFLATLGSLFSAHKLFDKMFDENYETLGEYTSNGDPNDTENPELAEGGVVLELFKSLKELEGLIGKLWNGHLRSLFDPGGGVHVTDSKVVFWQMFGDYNHSFDEHHQLIDKPNRLSFDPGGKGCFTLDTSFVQHDYKVVVCIVRNMEVDVDFEVYSRKCCVPILEGKKHCVTTHFGLAKIRSMTLIFPKFQETVSSSVTCSVQSSGVHFFARNVVFDRGKSGLSVLEDAILVFDPGGIQLVPVRIHVKDSRVVITFNFKSTLRTRLFGGGNSRVERKVVDHTKRNKKRGQYMIRKRDYITIRGKCALCVIGLCFLVASPELIDMEATWKRQRDASIYMGRNISLVQNFFSFQFQFISLHMFWFRYCSVVVVSFILALRAKPFSRGVECYGRFR